MIKPIGSFPVFVIENLAAARGFYCHNFDFRVAFQSSWYIHLAASEGIQLGFLVPNHPTQPECLHSPCSGEGIVFSLEVDNADSAYKEVQDRRLKILQEIKTEDWGQRHFILEDPNGIMVDVVQSI